MSNESLLNILSVNRTIGKQVDNLCAKEKARRIREAEKAVEDPLQEKMKDSWVKVVEEMLLKKFHGIKKVIKYIPRLPNDQD